MQRSILGSQFVYVMKLFLIHSIELKMKRKPTYFFYSQHTRKQTEKENKTYTHTQMHCPVYHGMPNCGHKKRKTVRYTCK